MTARSRQAQELAILKLYAVLSQAHFVKQQAVEWEGALHATVCVLILANACVQVVTARSRQAQELAILKLYAVLSQAHFVKQQAADWEGAFLGILALPFPLFLKHTADVVIHPDRGYSNMVSHPISLALLL